jgi:hypothetical protein
VRFFNDIQQCPRCAGLINREHFVKLEETDCVTTLLYCEHCEFGRESLWEKDADGYLTYAFSLDYFGRTEPQALGRLRERIYHEVAA